MGRNREGRDHYDRPSWSEIDKRKEKGSSGGKSSGAPFGQDKPPNRYQQKQLDKTFDNLFSDPEREAALSRIRSYVDKDGFAEAVNEYVKQFGLPGDYDVLQVIFEGHPETELRVKALKLMDELVDEQGAPTQQVFKSRIKILRLTGRVREIKKLAVQIAKARGL